MKTILSLKATPTMAEQVLFCIHMRHGEFIIVCGLATIVRNNSKSAKSDPTKRERNRQEVKGDGSSWERTASRSLREEEQHK